VSLVAACGSEGFTATPVTVTAQSGNKVELTGSWRSGCYSNGTDYIIDVRVYANNGRLSDTTEKYLSTDSSCATLVLTVANATAAYVSVADDKTALGWRDGTGNADTAPSDKSGSVLPTTPTVTTYSLPMDDSTSSKSISLIDDSVANDWVMYMADTADVDADGYHSYLATAHPLFQQ
jgi:hypothetical protein